ncbi:MAG TPA: heme-binding protein [Gammaproteobacteria bacterium]
MHMSLKKITAAVLASAMLSTPSFAEDVVTAKIIGMDLARDIVNATVKECRKMGYQVAAVVVDRGGNMKAALRDDFAARFTLQIAEEKANMSIMSGINSGEFLKERQDIRPELNHVDGIIVMRGGVIITSGGNRIGALGVSGAPGGDLDEACALKALKTFEERLEFAE